MDYHSLPRRQLQSLCKKHGIPANSTNTDMADALSALLNKPSHQESAKKPEQRATRSRETSSIAATKEVKGSGSVDNKDLPKSVRQKDEAPPSERRTRAREVSLQDSQKEEAAPSERRTRSCEVFSQDSQKGEAAAASDRRTRAREASALDGKRSARKDPINQVVSTDHSHTNAVKQINSKTIRGGGGVPLRRGKIKIRSPGRSPKRSQEAMNVADVEESPTLPVEVKASSTVPEEEAGCLVNEQKNVKAEAECRLNVQEDAKEVAECLVNVQENAKEEVNVHGYVPSMVADQGMVISEQSSHAANEEPEQEPQTRKKKGRVTFSDMVNFKEGSSFSSAVKFTPVSSTRERRTRSSRRETSEEEITEVREAGRSLRSLRVTTPVSEKLSSRKNAARKASVKVEAENIHVSAGVRELTDSSDTKEDASQVMPRSSTRKGVRKGSVDASGQDGESLLAPIDDHTLTRGAIVAKALKSEQMGTEIEREKDPAGMETTVELLDSRKVSRNTSSRLDCAATPSVGGSVSRTRSTVARGKVSSISQDTMAESLQKSTVGRKTRKSKALTTAKMVEEQKVSAERTKDMFMRTADEREGDNHIDRQPSELPDEAQTPEVVLGSSEGRGTSQSGLTFLDNSGKEMIDAEEEKDVLDGRSTLADNHDSPEKAIQKEEENKSTDVINEVNSAEGNLLVADGNVGLLESEEKFNLEDNHDPLEEVMQNEEGNKSITSIDVIGEVNSAEGNILVADGNIVSLGSEEKFSLEDNHDPSEEEMQNKEEDKSTDVTKEVNSAEGNTLVADGNVESLGSDEKLSLGDKMQEEQGEIKSTDSSSGIDKAEGNPSELEGNAVSLDAVEKSSLEDQMEKNEETEEGSPTNKICEIDTSIFQCSPSDPEDNAVSLEAAVNPTEETEEANPTYEVCEVDTSECILLEGDEVSVEAKDRESNDYKFIDDVETAEPVTLTGIDSGENSLPLHTALTTGKVTAIADERKCEAQETDQFGQSAEQFEELKESKAGFMEAEHIQRDNKLIMCVRDKEEVTIPNSGTADVMDGCLTGGLCEIMGQPEAPALDLNGYSSTHDGEKEYCSQRGIDSLITTAEGLIEKYCATGGDVEGDREQPGTSGLDHGMCDKEELVDSPGSPAVFSDKLDGCLTGYSSTHDAEREHCSQRGLNSLITTDEGLIENYCATGGDVEGDREQPGTPDPDNDICEKEELVDSLGSPAVFSEKLDKDTSALDEQEESLTAKDARSCEDLSSEAVGDSHDLRESRKEEKSMGTDLKAAMVCVDEMGRDDDVCRSEEAAYPSAHDGLDDSEQEQIETMAAKSYQTEANKDVFAAPECGAKPTAATQVDSIMTGFSRERSMQEIDYTLMSLRKLKQMCKKGREAAMMCKENREAAKNEIKTTHPGEVPLDTKRIALKTIPSNISVDSPNSKAQTPRPKNPLAVYEVIGGLTVAVSHLALDSSNKKSAALHHHG